MLRARHLHAPIGKAEIEGWLLCFTTAWAETVRDEALTEALMPKVEALAAGSPPGVRPLRPLLHSSAWTPTR